MQFTFLMPAYPGCPGKEAVKQSKVKVVQQFANASPLRELTCHRVRQ